MYTISSFVQWKPNQNKLDMDTNLRVHQGLLCIVRQRTPDSLLPTIMR